MKISKFCLKPPEKKSTHGGVFDPTQTDVNTIDGVTLARTVSFYDNEYGFTSNMIRTLLYFAEISE